LVFTDLSKVVRATCTSYSAKMNKGGNSRTA
jgi:hypothetical protein